MTDLIERFFSHFESAIIGLVGALLSLRFHPDAKERKAAAWFICAGMAIAYFTSGMATAYFSIDPKNTGAVSFLLGAFGGSLFSAVMRAVNNLDLLSMLKAKMGISDTKPEDKQ